jgi:hypothetical protein
MSAIFIEYIYESMGHDVENCASQHIAHRVTENNYDMFEAATHMRA